jgi:hypothetical protein
MVKLDETKSFAKRLAWVNKDDPSSFITQDSNSGALLFQNQLRRYSGLTKVQLPTQELAMSKATQFIESVGLMPLDFKTNGKLLHAGGLYAQDFNDGVAGEKSQKLVILNYGRELNGVAVQGPGSKMVVQLGDQGQIVSFTKAWNAVSFLSAAGSTKMFQPMPGPPPGGSQIAPQPGASQLPDTTKAIEKRGSLIERRTFDASKLKLRTTEYLTDGEVRNQINQDILNDWNTANLVEVNSIDLVYYDGDRDYIQPVYAVALTIHWGEDTLNFLYHVAALRNPPEAIYEVVQAQLPAIQQLAEPIPPPLLQAAGPGD